MKLNHTGFASWDSKTYNDGNSSGFSALPVGNRSFYGSGFFNRGTRASFREAVTKEMVDPVHFRVSDDNASFLGWSSSSADGFPVRCLKD